MNRYFVLFNKLGMRERLGLVFVIALVIYALMDIALIGPEEKRQKALRADIAEATKELGAVSGEMVIIKAQLEKDPFAKDRAQLNAYKSAIDEANTFLSRVDSDPHQVGNLLRQMIVTTPGVTLLSLKTLPVVPVIDTKTRAAAGAAKEAPGKNVYRRGIEVTVKGNYLALVPYLAKIQASSTPVLWSDADLAVQTYPDATLRVTIYTLSSQPEPSIG